LTGRKDCYWRDPSAFRPSEYDTLILVSEGTGVTKKIHDDSRNSRTTAGGAAIPALFKSFIRLAFSSFHRLRFAPLRRRGLWKTPTKPGTVRRHQSVSRTLHSATAEIVLRFAYSAQWGIFGGRALRSEGWTLICRVARPRRRSASGEKVIFLFLLQKRLTQIAVEISTKH
jgi:hypothetical protein